MPEDLDQLSTRELHDRAFKVARRRLDLSFLWDLVKVTPAAEAAAGHVDEAKQDILSTIERVADAIHPDTAEEADAFRPLYLEYLREHGKSD